VEAGREIDSDQTVPLLWREALDRRNKLHPWGENHATYIHAHMHIHAYIHTCIHAYIHTYIHAYTHAYMHTYIHAYIHTYIHTSFSDLEFPTIPVLPVSRVS
jgi:hypothetical protein